MGYTVKDTGSNFERPTPGMHAAVCMGYYPIGKQPSNFADQPPKEKVIIVFEIEQRLTKGDFVGQRFVQSKEYTASLSEKANLRKDLENWRGKGFDGEELQGFDMDRIVGKPCMLNLVEKTSAKTGRTRMDIAAILPLMKDMERMTPELPRDHVFDWIEEKKANAVKEEEPAAVASGAGVADEIIPF